MRRSFFSLVALSIILLAGCEGDDPAVKKTASENVENAASETNPDPEQKAKAAFDELSAVFDKAQDEFRALMGKAESDEDRKTLFEKHYPKPEDYSERFVGIYNEHPDSKFGLKALQWAASRDRESEHGQNAISTLIDKHIDSDGMAELAFAMQYGKPAADVEANLDRFILNATDESVIGAAKLAKANYMMGLIDYKKSLDELKGQIDEETCTYIENSSFSNEQILTVFNDVADNYADLKAGKGARRTLGEIASSSIFALEVLAIGNEAPEIEAEDLDGVSFKLSDYRGKVVVLDFWGDW